MISYCITVYNEVDYIQQLINTILAAKQEDEEIVVVQTHKDESEKNTQWYQDIYNYLKNNNIIPYEYRFDGKFAKLKNYLTSLATKTYILNLDADENLKDEAFPIIRQILKENDLDLYLFPRINTVEGITEDDIQKWSWRVNERGWINWPDFQPRLYKNNKKILWQGDVHETLQGYENYGAITENEFLAITHHKEINRQREQNTFYDQIAKKISNPISIQKYRVLIGLCSWNNFYLLKSCIDSILSCIDHEKDGIAVVLNEPDPESINYLYNLGIPFVCNNKNGGPLAIDFLKPFIEQSEYFLNTNDDMIYHGDFISDLINIIDSNYPCSASCGLIENFNSNNLCVVVDTSLSKYDDFYIQQFHKNYDNLKYKTYKKIISYNHPIMVKSKDFLNIGGYSGNWDRNFLSGYGRDDMFAYELWKFNNAYKFICSNNSFVFHLSSGTMKKLSHHYRQQNHNQDLFIKYTNMNIIEFRQKINYGSEV
jgi:GT2 family glycosyltransferase